MHGQNIDVCTLKKGRYGLKQAPHEWYSRIDEYSLTLGSTNTVGNPNFYYLYNKPDLLVLVLYVDDLILTSSYEKPIALCSQQVRYEGHHPCTLLFGSPGLLGCK